MPDVTADDATPVEALPFAVTAEGAKPARGKRMTKAVPTIENVAADTPIIPAVALVAPPEPAVAADIQNEPVATTATSTTESAPAPALLTEDKTMDTTETFNTAETVIDTATAQVQGKTQALFGDMNDRAKGAMEKGAKLFEDMNAFSKGNIEAMVESSKIAAKGVETISQNTADYVRRAFETSTAAAKTLAQTKSPTEFLKLQGDFARQSFDAMVAETSRSTEVMLKLAGEIAQPLSSRFAVAAEKMKIAA